MNFNRYKLSAKTRFFRIVFRNRTSAPYLSGDSFAALADLVVTHELLSDIQKLSNSLKIANIVFCPSPLLETFIEIYPSSKQVQVLLVGNGDKNFTENPQEYKRIAKFIFLQNSFISDNDRIYTLPIGIENLKLGVNGLIKFSPNPVKSKFDRVMVGPFSPTITLRAQFASKKFADSDKFDFFPERLSLQEYSRNLHDYSFVLCPEGNGVDTHRVWETLYAGSTPIILQSSWAKSLTDLDIPLVITESWETSDIESAIKAIAHQTTSPEAIPALWVEYWRVKFKNLVTN